MNIEKKDKVRLTTALIPFVLLLSFWVIAIVLWRTTGESFYLFNFGYIGTAVGVGIGLYTMLPRKRKPWGRRFAQLFVGVYLLVFLGLLMRENMQLEGCMFHLLAGFFASSVIHYMVAKVFGPILHGRAYCSWACWTAMVLDFLPFKRNQNGRLSAKWGALRYIHFGASILVVCCLWFVFRYRPNPRDQTTLIWMIGGNICYYVTGIFLAIALKDNRAFCKYVCPITAIIKVTSRFSLLKIEADTARCTQCGACNRACPMDIDIMAYIRNEKRVLSTECILCMTCTTVCPQGIIDSTFKFDIGGAQYLQQKKHKSESHKNHTGDRI